MQSSEENSLSRTRKSHDFGATTVFAHREDPRFSYTLYVPPAIQDSNVRIDLVVVMHGTGRQFSAYRDAFEAFGRWKNCLVMCPLFPANVCGDDNRDGYKHLIEGNIRYDQVLLDMVTDVGNAYGRTFHRFALFGYSGGGQFANRFAFVHPDRLWAVSIGAPGSVTLIDERRDWWVGLGGFRSRFGKDFNVEALRRVPVQMIVGQADLETWEITHRAGRPYFMSGANDAGSTRPQRLQTLASSFRQADIEVRFDELPNVSHNGLQVVPTVQDFLADVLSAERATAANTATLVTSSQWHARRGGR
ncbi:alpha/beta hydrolase [Paraburkholderia sp. BCC1884]|uniref:alpha/beta hydrolase n=1 Tax=Paraburkholderia sp. BCC1884 TaxID=2562668 RepID=UPI0011836023|nr:alpha/beta hydrolase [Paraburkholderia sp. BCC1884]